MIPEGRYFSVKCITWRGKAHLSEDFQIKTNLSSGCLRSSASILHVGEQSLCSVLEVLTNNVL